MKDYYRVMGIESEATGEEIKKAYRKLVMRHHPDRNRGDPDCEDRLREINDAYQVLGDEENRRKYDLLRRQSFDSLRYQDLNDEWIAILRTLAREGFGLRGGCKGGGFKRRGCRRWKENF